MKNPNPRSDGKNTRDKPCVADVRTRERPIKRFRGIGAPRTDGENREEVLSPFMKGVDNKREDKKSKE